MPSTTVRLNVDSWETLRRIAKESGRPLQEILAEAIEQYRRKVFLEQANTEYAALRAQPEGWAEELAERRPWESTLLDGLEDDET